MIKMTKLSIITINRNNAAGLRKTMESVFSQTYRDFEYIVVDGASTDGSVEVIKEFEQKFNPSLQGEELCSIEGPVDVHRTNKGVGSFKWISEPDTGIYNAMNKGCKLANGEYLLMLNSADFLVNECVVENILPELHTDDIIQGNLIEDCPKASVRNHGYGKSEVSFFDVLDAYFPHQAIFISKEALIRYGYYDESYKKASDTYFFITALVLHNATFRYIDIDISNFDQHGISNDPLWIQVDKEEDERWYNEHIPHRILDVYYSAPKKIRLYDQIHRHKVIWYMTMLLVRISEWLNPSPANIKKEKI